MRSLAAVLGLKTSKMTTGLRTILSEGSKSEQGTISVGVATAVFGRLDLEVAAEELTGSAAQTVSDRHREVALDSGMAEAAAGHGGGFDAIEFVAQFLPFLPFKEFGERHRFPHSEVHGDHYSTFPHLLQPGEAGRVGSTRYVRFM